MLKYFAHFGECFDFGNNKYMFMAKYFFPCKGGFDFLY